METVKTDGTGGGMLDFSKRLLEHRYLPAVFAIGAILVTLPALKMGLVLDDLPERAVALRPDQLPARMHETGNPADSGSFQTVLRDFFLNRSPEEMALMKNYGALPWWTPDNLNIGLWRPVSAFTHWLDYRLFPDSPALMHAHNIAWFAAVVFLITIVYRTLMGTGRAAGLAALLYLLDGNTYFPVAFVANRGFLLALFFGLMCLYEHHKWRTTKSRSGLVSSVLFLALSLFSEESGVATFAFILAYALVLEQGSFRSRALTVLPSILIIVSWRIVYEALGFGLHGVDLYIDPVHCPLQFAWGVIPRGMVVLGGQLAGVPPDFLLAVKPSLRPAFIALYGGVVVAALVVFLPWVLRDKTAAFWFTVMLLAAIPASAVAPMSKNFGFVAVGAYGLIASFVASLMTRPSRLPEWLAYRTLAWVACVLLILMHVPGAIAERVETAKATPNFFNMMDRLIDLGDLPDAENKNVIVVNLPCPFALIHVPSYKAFHHQTLPKTIRALVPGCTSFDVQRTDDKTLVVQSQGPDIFSCEDMGPIHAAYFCRTLNMSVGGAKLGKGERRVLPGLTVEVQKVSQDGLPTRVAFRFDSSLDSPGFHWLQFDWPTFSCRPFKVPFIGQSITLSGPSQERWRKPSG